MDGLKVQKKNPTDWDTGGWITLMFAISAALSATSFAVYLAGFAYVATGKQVAFYLSPGLGVVFALQAMSLAALARQREVKEISNGKD